MINSLTHCSTFYQQESCYWDGRSLYRIERPLSGPDFLFKVALIRSVYVKFTNFETWVILFDIDKYTKRD